MACGGGPGGGGRGGGAAGISWSGSGMTTSAVETRERSVLMGSEGSEGPAP